MSLKDPRPHWESCEGLQHDRAWRLAAALIRFDFNYGDMVWWLGDEYTNEHRDWTEVSDALDSVRSVEPLHQAIRLLITIKLSAFVPRESLLLEITVVLSNQFEQETRTITIPT